MTEERIAELEKRVDELREIVDRLLWREMEVRMDSANDKLLTDAAHRALARKGLLDPVDPERFFRELRGEPNDRQAAL